MKFVAAQWGSASRSVFSNPFYWLLVPYLALHTVNSLSLSWLALSGLSSQDTLLLRGLSALIWVLMIASIQQQSPLPRHPMNQLQRGCLGGLAIAAMVAAFTILPPSVAAIFTRMDTAMLIMGASLHGSRSYGIKQKWIAFLALVLPLAFFLITDDLDAWGVACGYLASLLLACSYILLKSSAKSERMTAVVLTPSVAMIALALLWGVDYSQTAEVLRKDGVVIVVALTGLVVYLVYALTAKLYQLTDIAGAEYPTLFSAILLVPLEFYLFETRHTLTYVSFLVLLVVMLGLVLRSKARPRGSL